MSKAKIVGRVLLVILGVVVLVEGATFLKQGTDYWLYRTFASRQEAARREVFKESQAYNDGMAQELWSLEEQYNRADATGKASLRSIILRKVAAYDTERLNPELRGFIMQLRREQKESVK